MEKIENKASLKLRDEIAALNINVFTFYTDPAHGWLKVPVILLRLMKLDDQISTCSYISSDRKTAYLEEDVDANLFIKRYFEIMGLEMETLRQRIKFVNDQSSSWIRDLPHFN